MDCFLCLYLAALLVGFLGLERHPTGSPLARCDGCHYDLRGLPATAVCPECGSALREGSGPATELVLRPRGALMCAPGGMVVLLAMLAPGVLREVAGYPAAAMNAGGLLQGQFTQEAQVLPLVFTAMISPLLTKLATPRTCWLSIGGALLAGYLVSAASAITRG